MTLNLDFMKTIEDDAEVENLSDDSDAEVEVSHIKCKTTYHLLDF